MELLTPHIGLIIWTVISIAHLILIVFAIIRLSALPLSFELKFAWLLFIIFIPLLGTASFFYSKKQASYKVGITNILFINGDDIAYLQTLIIPTPVYEY